MRGAFAGLVSVYVTIGMVLASPVWLSYQLAAFLVPGRLYEQSGGSLWSAIFGTAAWYAMGWVFSGIRVAIWPYAAFLMLTGGYPHGFMEWLFPGFYGMPSIAHVG